ncbi:MAG: peptidoglycan editing factor PgeF [Deltaproteobacteria bacterium]|nr:peptidoglycan editing factor PgeF [Deltaproteobacteria bacterium]
MIRICKSHMLEAAGFPLHGFTTRHGGVSAPPYDTLNLGLAVGDDPDAVAENHRRLERHVGLDAAILSARQVHGTAIALAADLARERPDRRELPAVEADGIVCADPREAVGVRTADCAAILLAEPRSRLVAAVHAGWRGAAGGVVAAGVAALVSHGASLEGILAAIGPCICGRCYEVGDDVASLFPDAARPSPEARGKHLLDLPLAVELALRAAGLHARNIDRADACTRCNGSDFFSHRGSGVTGRNMGFICGGVR